MADINIANTLPHCGPIGIFDSGYGGLTILREIQSLLPAYDYLYLGDNARAPYGTRSFKVVYEFTLQAVKALFEQGCPLVILACNTASAKALRTIQQNDLPNIDPSRRVLGIIRPTVEHIAASSPSGQIGILATEGTVRSHSYDMEMAKLRPDFTVTSQAAPMWVSLVENHEAQGPGADYFVKLYIDRLLQQNPSIDTILLACTHFPILYPKIRQTVAQSTNILCQGEIVAKSLKNYLQRHPEIDRRITQTHSTHFLTTEDPASFQSLAEDYLGHPIQARHIAL